MVFVFVLSSFIFHPGLCNAEAALVRIGALCTYQIGRAEIVIDVSTEDYELVNMRRIKSYRQAHSRRSL